MRDLQLLTPDVWRPRSEAHRARARRWTTPHLERRLHGEKHPVDDFLWEYYNLSPAQLERWHPGVGVGLVDAPEYTRLGAYVTENGVSTVDTSRLAGRREGLRWTRELLARTAGRPARFGCFGLHEWAMVYRTDGPRHPQLELRLGADGTDAVVEENALVCTHVDAFRFFTDAARPLNVEVLGREHQLDREQPGCLHASMDLYKVAFRLLPFVESTIVLDAFELAHDVRVTDMEASPYDVRPLGLGVVAVETPEGKAEYVRRQREFTARAEPLRRSLLDLCDSLLSWNPAPSPATA